MSETRPFRPAWWLPGAHLQTLWGRLVRSRTLVSFRREVLETPDGDELILDHVDGPDVDSFSRGRALAAPLSRSPALAPLGPGLDAAFPRRGRLLVLHGLEGSSHSVYVQGLLWAGRRHGLRGTALNFRSCARDPRDLSRMLPNRRPRLYHSGETGDLDFVVRTLAAREPGVPLAAVGVSLGGNVLLKWLGENPGQTILAAAAALSTPFDLAESARHLETRIGTVYVRSFLSTLVRKARETAARFPEAAARMDLPRAARARSFWEFDEAANAPLHGFAGADDYYRRSSSLAFLSRITTPTLCLSALDDPFLPASAFERAREAASPSVEFLAVREGGHIGFVSGSLPWRAGYWAEDYAVDWVARRIGGGEAMKKPGSG